jgi:hypothetical protein
VKPADAAARKLLRWYPPAWRERYGEEFLAMVEDSLDGGRPTWRLRLGVAMAGLRERGHQGRLAGQEASLRVARGLRGRPGMAFMAASIFAALPLELFRSPPPSRVWQANAILDVLAGVVVFTAFVILAGGLAALPAFVGFLRAGGWPKIRRRVTRAAGATVAAGGGLAGLVIVARSHTYAQLNTSWAYGGGEVATLLALMVALWLWTGAARATARQLDLAPRVRAAEKIFGVVTVLSLSVMVAVNVIWYASIEASVPLLLLGLTTIALQGPSATWRMRQAVRSARRVRPGA